MWYDAELGWVRASFRGLGRKTEQAFSQPLLMAFGDSFVYGDEVEAHQAWPAQLAQQARREVYNFGVSGFGPDQAYLYFRRLIGQIKTPYAVMGITHENINRIVNVYRPFYLRETELKLTKPRFVLSQQGLRLEQNPISTEQDLVRLQDIQFVIALGRSDPWFLAQRERKFQLVTPYVFNFLYSGFWQGLLSASALSETSPRRALDLWRQPEVVRLLGGILREFALSARAARIKPILVILPAQISLDVAHPSYELGLRQLDKICVQLEVLCVNAVQELGRHAKSNGITDLTTDVMLYRQEGGHLSPLGNQVVAAAVWKAIQSDMSGW